MHPKQARKFLESISLDRLMKQYGPRMDMMEFSNLSKIKKGIDKLKGKTRKELFDYMKEFNDNNNRLNPEQIKSQAYTIIFQNKHGRLLAYNYEGRLTLFDSKRQFQIEKKAVSLDKFKQPDVIDHGTADRFKIKGPKGYDISIANIADLRKPYSELVKMRNHPALYLRKHGIKTKKQIKVFEEYMDYVKKVQAEVYKLRNNAKGARQLLDTLMFDVASQTDVVKKGTDLIGDGSKQGGNHNGVPIKGVPRTIEKCLDPAEYNGDASKLLDLARGTLEYKSVAELYKALKLIQSYDNVDKVYIKNNIGDPNGNTPHPANYRDMNVSIRFKNGKVVELQLHMRSMLKMKEKGGNVPGFGEFMKFTNGERELAKQIAESIKKPHLRLPKGDFVKGHELYEFWRAIPENASPEMKDFKEKIARGMKKAYGDGWKNREKEK
jgi:hypothetical protein